MKGSMEIVISVDSIHSKVGQQVSTMTLYRIFYLVYKQTILWLQRKKEGLFILMIRLPNSILQEIPLDDECNFETVCFHKDPS